MIDLTKIETRNIALDGNYHPEWEPRPAHRPWGYFRGPDGRAYDYGRIAQELRSIYGHLRGRPIREQLQALGLLDVFDEGDTPCFLPISFF